MRGKTRGFTIVELVIVIAVVAIMAAVLIPTLSAVTRRAKEAKMTTECVNALKEYRAVNPDAVVYLGDNAYPTAYFIYKIDDKNIHYFRSDADDNLVEIEADELPDFASYTHFDLYTEDPADLSESARAAKAVRCYRIDDTNTDAYLYYIHKTSDGKGLSTILLANDVSALYYYREGNHYAGTTLSGLFQSDVTASTDTPDPSDEPTSPTDTPDPSDIPLVPNPPPSSVFNYVTPLPGYYYHPNPIDIDDYTAPNLDDSLIDDEGFCFDRFKNTLIGYIGTATVISVPDQTPDGRAVNVIGTTAFAFHQDITDVTIPESVTSVGSNCFTGCTALRSVTLPVGLQTISTSAFYGCTSLETVVIPPESEVSINTWAFARCPNLTDLVLPVGVTLLPGAFSGVKDIGFAGENPYETEKYKVTSNCLIQKDNKTLLSGNAYSVIPDDGTVKIIGKWSFAYIDTPFQLYIPPAVDTIGNNAFEKANVTDITGGEALTLIGANAFTDSAIRSIRLSATLERIGQDVFTGCIDLVLTVENGINIEGWCAGVKSIMIEGNNPTYRKVGSVIVRRADNTFVASERQYDFTPEEGVVYTIGYKAFATCILPADYVLPDCVSVEREAFAYCEMESVTIGEHVENIGLNAFAHCTHLEAVTILGPVETLDAIFADDAALTEVILPDTITTIRGATFSGCGSLGTIRFGGTKAQWEAIRFDHFWDSWLPSYSVHCSDYTILKVKQE